MLLESLFPIELYGLSLVLSHFTLRVTWASLGVAGESIPNRAVWTQSRTVSLYSQGYLGQVLSRQCGLMVVGLEREEDRVTAAMKRVKSSTADPLTTAETSALDSASTASTASGAPTPASATAVQCSKFPEALKATPRGQVSACHLSVQLNVTDSRESKAKVAALLDELQCT